MIEPTNFKKLEDEVESVIRGRNEKSCEQGNRICNLDGKVCDYHYSGGWKWYHRFIPLMDLFIGIPNYANWRCRQSPSGDPRLSETYLPYYDGVHGNFIDGCSYMKSKVCSKSEITIVARQ